MRRRILPAVCVRADLLAATLSLLPVTVGEMRESSWRAMRMMACLCDAKEETVQRGMAQLNRLTEGRAAVNLTARVHPLLRKRRLARAALEARLRRCQRRAPTEGRLSPADWEFSWSLFIRPMLVLDAELAAELDGLLTGGQDSG
ncbi:MAG TPA: hypothetical protein VGL40_14550 [Bacillota bacterium]